MSQIILPGNNALTLCGSALMQIVQEHITSRTYGGREDPKVRVTGVKYDGTDHTFTFALTTDAAKADA